MPYLQKNQLLQTNKQNYSFKIICNYRGLANSLNNYTCLAHYHESVCYYFSFNITAESIGKVFKRIHALVHLESLASTKASCQHEVVKNVTGGKVSASSELDSKQ